MRTPRSYAVAGLALGFAWAVAGGCSVSSQDAADSGPGSAGTGVAGSPGAPVVVLPDAGDVGGGVRARLNALCGGPAAGACTPDDAIACRGYVPPAEPGAGGGGGEGPTEGGVGGQGGASEQGGTTSQGGASGQGGTGDGSDGLSGAGGVPGLAGAGGQGGDAATDPGLAPFSCQVVRLNDELLRQCAPAGSGSANAPCFTAADCAPSLACVTDGDAGRCLPYCCDADHACDTGTYCAERSLRKSPASVGEPPRVPVCVPADACSLEDPFPCPADTDCRCKGGTACMVVRDDGTTTCVEPGAGRQGDACPCAWNHVCSSTTNHCLKICRTDPTKNDCGAQKCQASSELPKGFGVCVGLLN